MTMMMMCHWIFTLLLACFLCSVQASNSIHHRRGMVGAYFPAKVNDPFVQTVTEFAMKELRSSQYEFVTVPVHTLHSTVVRAQQQVVAGRNYKLLITLSNEETCLGAFEVTVYDHFGDLSITHWGPGMTCEQAKAMTEEKELQVSDSSEWND